MAGILQATPVQGITNSGQPLNNPAVAPVPIGGTNGTNMYNVSCDTSGRLLIVGAASSSASAAGAPVQVGGVGADGNAYALRVDSNGQLSVNSEGQKKTFSVGGVLTPAAAATDIVALIGSSTKKVRVTRVEVTIAATAAGIIDVLLIKRSTANTGGTSTNPTIVPHDATDTVTATLNQYSANPTAGTAVGTVRAAKVGIVANTTATRVWTFTERNTKGIVLPAATDLLCINLNGATLLAGEVCGYSIEFTEE